MQPVWSHWNLLCTVPFYFLEISFTEREGMDASEEGNNNDGEKK